MPIAIANLLIVDDDPALRTSLSAIFAHFGHRVRSASDGFSGLAELRLELPDIILSDLNMPGMSGFEFLSVVRRRFPAIQVIAMSSEGAAGAMPLGVAADAFYQKGSGLGSLLPVVEAMAGGGRQQLLSHNSMPIRVEQQEKRPSRLPCIMITCPECLRTFPQISGDAACPLHETRCTYCNHLFPYAIVQAPIPALRKERRLKLIRRPARRLQPVRENR